jgi:hypothetical protein
MSRYRNVTLAADVMYVNGIPMLVTISRNLRFATVEALPNRNITTLVKGIKAVATVYRRASFTILATLMDGELEAMRGDLADLGIALNETARDEHVGDIERFIRTLKERMRAIYTTLPFKHVPPRVVIEMAKHAVYWLNAFHHPNGVSNSLSPRTIITGQTVDFNWHCKYEFGQYVQTHEQHDKGMAPRTIGALAMRPTGNAQGNTTISFSCLQDESSTGRTQPSCPCQTTTLSSAFMLHKHDAKRPTPVWCFSIAIKCPME